MLVSGSPSPGQSTFNLLVLLLETHLSFLWHGIPVPIWCIMTRERVDGRVQGRKRRHPRDFSLTPVEGYEVIHLCSRLSDSWFHVRRTSCQLGRGHHILEHLLCVLRVILLQLVDVSPLVLCKSWHAGGKGSKSAKNYIAAPPEWLAHPVFFHVKIDVTTNNWLVLRIFLELRRIGFSGHGHVRHEPWTRWQSSRVNHHMLFASIGHFYGRIRFLWGKSIYQRSSQ